MGSNKIIPINNTNKPSTANKIPSKISKMSYSAALKANTCKECDKKPCECVVKDNNTSIKIKKKSNTLIVPINYTIEPKTDPNRNLDLDLDYDSEYSNEEYFDHN